MAEQHGGDTRRVRRRAKRRKAQPVIVIHVTRPGRIVIEHGTREDAIDAPEGTTIERPKVLTKTHEVP
jgi:hypothetical protein